MDLKAWLVSTKGVVITAVVLTLVVLAESIFPPWAPFSFINKYILDIFDHIDCNNL